MVPKDTGMIPLETPPTKTSPPAKPPDAGTPGGDVDDGGEQVLSGEPREEGGHRDPKPKEVSLFK